MRARGADARLRWAFLLALALHAAALAIGPRLPSHADRGGESFDRIRVFDTRAPTIVSPVELVTLPRITEAEQGIEVTPQPQPAAAPRPTSAPRVVQEVPERPARVPARPGFAPSQPLSGAPARSAAARPASPRGTPDAGGGGGGPVALGSPSPNGDLGGLASGPTQPGALPGEGGGSGSGSGPGTGEGSGGGRGAGNGAGERGGDGGGRGGEATQTGPAAAFTPEEAGGAEPAVIWKGELEYPSAAADEGVEGVVVLKVLVTEAGKVSDVQIAESSGDRRLDAAAKRWVKTWRYRPAMWDGKPRAVWTYATVRFVLK